VNAKRVRVWALLMAPDSAVVLQRAQPGGTWRTVARLRAGRSGVLNALVALRGAMRLRVRAGTLVSAPVSVPRVRSRL
jgi:hypothetical protein